MPKKHATIPATLPETTELTKQPAAPKLAKKSILIVRLQSPDGTTVPDLCAELGWLPHTVRAAFSGLRKAGYSIDRSMRGDGTTAYSIAVEATDDNA